MYHNILVLAAAPAEIQDFQQSRNSGSVHNKSFHLWKSFKKMYTTCFIGLYHFSQNRPNALIQLLLWSLVEFKVPCNLSQCQVYMDWTCTKTRKQTAVFHYWRVNWNRGLRESQCSTHQYWTKSSIERKESPSAGWDSVNVLLSADVLVLLRGAGHFADADSILDVFELQTEVLTRDGQHGSSLPGARLWKQLVGRTN